jgi:RND family efflux transporter MFP subunit
MIDAQAVPPAKAVRRAKVLALVLVAFLLLGALVIFALRALHAADLEQAMEVHAKQYVAVISPTPGGRGLPLTLPGTLQGINEATVYARSNGYILRWHKDIGAQVRKGELLAEITAPELDQEYAQAAAAQQLAASSEELAKSTAQRWQSLREKDAVTQQDMDERSSAYHQAQANLASSQANAARLQNLRGFNRVLAPFDGVITRRNIDVGDLVDAGNGGAGKALFTIAQVDPLRLYVFVPQQYAAQVNVGDSVTVSLAENAAAAYRGSIARTARAIDAGTRTMQVEIRVPNPDGALIAGSYVQVTLPIKQNQSALIVPTNVLLFRPDGTRVATIDAQGTVTLKAIKLGTDFGSTVAVLSGLQASDRIVLNPADSLADGDIVNVVAPAPRAPAPPAAAPPAEAPPAAATATVQPTLKAP